jgi:tetratricopeptide (TPR) repeat protein
VQLSFLLVCAALWAGCGDVLSSGAADQAPAAAAPELPAGIRALRVRIAQEIAIVVEGNADPELGARLNAALQSELARLGIAVVHPGSKVFDVLLRVETRVTGAVSFLRGRVGLAAEKSGVVLASASTGVELHGGGEFPAVMMQKAVASLLATPALAEYAQRNIPLRELEHAQPLTAVATRPTRPAPQPPVPVAARPAKAVPNPVGEARAHSNRGTGLYNLGRFSEALVEFEAAYLAVQDPPFLFNIAQCQRKMGNNREALETYRAYLRVAPAAPNRTEVQRHISELERQAHASR